MENVYNKQFPGLMKGKKIMYVHGFMSSGQTGTVGILQNLLPDASVIAEDIPLHPEEGLAMLQEMAAREKPDLIIGTSMGGMYTEMLSGYDRILVNPAFEMGKTMGTHGMMGKQTYQNPRKDGQMEVVVTKALEKEYDEMTHHCFQMVTSEEQQRVFGLFGDEDPLVHTFDIFHQHYPQAIRFHGEHRLNEKVIMHYLVPVIRWIDDRQEGRERPVVYLDFNVLHDSYQKPLSSMHKAYEQLIENYEVYIVAPALTDEHQSLTEVQDWVEQYLSSPAWNHVIFCNQTSLLYGDYLISACPSEGFMGTGIRFGSEEFKTWEEIITFFERLGGQ
ncbi:MAG: esterase [Prevotella sp.]|jgi:predicted esterase YcpF (UPF0227 family)|nr:esterase [Prevotella sp.]MCI1282188.1 esterase [Prevotella sp.]